MIARCFAGSVPDLSSLSRAPLDFEVSTPALPAFTADVGFVGEVPDPLRVSLSRITRRGRRPTAGMNRMT